MKSKSLLLIVFVALLALLLSSCAKAPQEKVDAAKAAIEAARAVEAHRYLPDEFNAAEDALKEALAEIEVQNGKFAFTRNYDKAALGLDAAKNMAEEVIAKVDARKEEVKEESNALLGELTNALEEAKKLLKRAPRGKGEKEAVQMIENDLNAVERSLVDINSLLESGDSMGAKDKAQAGLSKVNSLINELQTAIAKKSGR